MPSRDAVFAVQDGAGKLLTGRFTTPTDAWTDFAERAPGPAAATGATLVRFLHHDEQPIEIGSTVFVDIPPGVFTAFRDQDVVIRYRPADGSGSKDRVDWFVLQCSNPRVPMSVPPTSTARYDASLPRTGDTALASTLRTALRSARAQAAELERVLRDHDLGSNR